MRAARTAEIIPFPTRKSPEISQNSGLDTAPTALDIALAEQRVAVSAWRESLTELHAVMGRLGAGVAECEDRLANLGARVATLNTDARAMADWADAALAPHA